MTINGTYLQLQFTIADELGDRQDLLSPLADSNLTLSPIKNAIQSAIAMWEREPFYFNELYDANWFTTTPGQEFYNTTNTVTGDASEIASMAQIIAVHINPVLTDPNRYPMIPRTWQYIDQISINQQVTSTFPVDYAYFGETIRLYPIPAQISQMTVSGIQRLPNLVNDSDTNVWVQDGWDLIRASAKLYLANHVLYDDDLATRMTTEVYGAPPPSPQRGYLKALKAETYKRGLGPRVRPTHFSLAWLALPLLSIFHGLIANMPFGI